MISVVIIVKNEEACIARCLDSVRDADEIVIVDTGSTDATESVIRGMNLPHLSLFMGEYKWRDDFADARNFALAKASGEWRLSIDADDWMEPGAIAKIKDAIVANPNSQAFPVSIVNDGHPNDHYTVTRIIRRGVKFVGAVHELPDARGEGHPVATMYRGHSPAHAADPDIDLRILSKSHAKDPSDTRTMYYLAREYWYRKDFETAITIFSRYVRTSSFRAERADAYLYLARMHWLLGQGDVARDHCLQAIAINANFREALLLMEQMSFSENAARWRDFAALADNSNVLFVRA